MNKLMAGSFKKSLDNFVLPRKLTDGVGLPHHLPRAAAYIEELLSPSELKPPAKIDLDRTYSYLRIQWKRGTPLASMDKKQLKMAPWVIFDMHRPQVLAGDGSFSEDYLDWLRKRKTTSLVSSLLFSFLKEYPKKLSTFNLWRQAMHNLLESSNTLRLRKWLNAASQYHLLEENGPEKFAEAVLDGDQAPEEILRSAKLEGELENQGFSRWAYVAGLRTVESRLSSDALTMKQLDRLMQWSQRDNTTKGLRYSTEKRFLAESLLRPFMRRAAPEEMKKKIKSFLVYHLGDPRFQGEQWFGVSEQSMQVIRSWMIEASLEYFFRVLDHTADPTWMYRKAFWGAFLDRGYIREAWPILGKMALRAVKRAKNAIEEEVLCGTLSGAIMANQSVLVLVIGDLLITEWSHHGKCRIWHLEEDGAQALKKRWFYNTDVPVTGDELRSGAHYEVIHSGSEYGRWQQRIYAYINKHTGINIPYKDLMPGDVP
ncbi:MAG: EH signature domain-containing protein [Desulfosoma sp.]|uniref:EH signature domain-containing protein n=1 Tax=Desulfosoma sp. TaxID=2603217 RepID=UPI00404B2A4E